MKRKGFLAILTAMAMIGSMGVCVYAADDAASTEDVLADYTGKADYKIGFSQCTLASPFYVTMKEVAEDYAKQLGVDFVCVSADDDVTKHEQRYQDMISSWNRCADPESDQCRRCCSGNRSLPESRHSGYHR